MTSPRARNRSVSLAIALACVAAPVGCGVLWIDPPAPSPSILKEASPSSDAVTVDIYWATLPPGLEGNEEGLWRFVQEDRLDEALRYRLRRNGLRAGVVCGAPPDQIVKMLNPKGSATDESQENALSTVVDPTGVRRSTQQLRPGKEATIHAADTLREAPVLLAQGDRISGETYYEVQPVYSLRAELRDDGGYQVVLTPELHYGDARMRWSSDETGMITLGAASREKKVFPELRIEAPLVVGEMLLASSWADAGSSLGHYFHRAEGRVEGRRKAILIRLTRTPPKPVFGSVAE